MSGELSGREIEALAAFARRGGQSQAADDLGISLHTMKNHLANVYAKLDVASGIDAFRAIGWLRVPGDLAETKAAAEMQALIGRAERVYAELVAFLRASGSDAGSSNRSQDMSGRLNSPADEGGPVAGSASVAATPTPSLHGSIS